MIQILILVATIGIIVSYIYLTLQGHTEIEHFKQNILEEEEDEDEPRDLPWIASWSVADKKARQGHNCKVKYSEKDFDGITIITTSKSCESGLPHTRAGGRIIIPDSVPLPLRADIIEHERIHIHQSRHLAEWTQFYHRSWSFELYKTPPPGLATNVIESKRSNPDTWMSPWCCWMGRFWPFEIYTNMQVPSLRESATVWWDSWSNSVLTEPPHAWTEFFGRPDQKEHPHEIAAVMIVNNDTHTEAGRRLNNWWVLKGKNL